MVLRKDEFNVGWFEPSDRSQAMPTYPAKALTQAVPFQCAISELVVDTAVSWSPTAQASVPERALTPERRLAGGAGVGGLVFGLAAARPREINGAGEPLGGRWLPTAEAA